MGHGELLRWGYAGQVVRMMAKVGFSYMDAGRMEVHVEPDNTARTPTTRRAPRPQIRTPPVRRFSKRFELAPRRLDLACPS